MELTSLEDLLIEELKDLYSAEKQLIKALPKMARAATNEELKAGFEEHLAQTEEHVTRLEQAFELLGQTPKAKKCKAMEGLIEEGSEMIKEDAEDDVKDAGLIAAAQKVEHYEIASYGTVRAYAEIIGNEEVAQLLQQTLDEEKETDQKLTDLAMSTINIEAADEEVETEEEREMAGSGSGGRYASGNQGDEERKSGKQTRSTGSQTGSRSTTGDQSRSKGANGGQRGNRR